MSGQIPAPRDPADDRPSGLERLATTLTDVRVAIGRAEERAGVAAEMAEDHETRIRALERWRWSLPATAGASALAAVSSLLVTLLSHPAR